jgi:hypothetical protein
MIQVKKSELLLLIGAISLAAMFLFVVIYSFMAKPETTPQDIPTPTPIPLINNSPAGKEVMTTSGQEIQKITESLPFSEKMTTAEGQDISITLQRGSSSSELNARIEGVDYFVNESDEENYAKNRNSFLQGAQSVFRWIESNGANTPLIIINWSDNPDIQYQAEKWLQGH